MKNTRTSTSDNIMTQFNEETIAVGNINNLKNTDPAKYLKYMKEHRNEN